MISLISDTERPPSSIPLMSRIWSPGKERNIHSVEELLICSYLITKYNTIGGSGGGGGGGGGGRGTGAWE